MKKIVVVVADGCVESVFTDSIEDFELEIVNFDSAFDSHDEQEALGDYIDQVRATMKSL
jgi:hypothetical protein